MQLSAELCELLSRYVRPLPRYTSYPTAPEWSDEFGPCDHRQAVEQVDGDVSIYVHVPFCRSLCHFCACNRIITRDEALPQRYLDTLEREIELTREVLGGEVRVAQLHLGGGTPTHLTATQLTRLVDAVDRSLPRRDDAEVSIEVDPRVTTDDHVAAIGDCGFDRVSLGVQDFDAKVQEAIHRIQPKSVTQALVERLRSVGVSSIGFDLIYGLPFQTCASLERTLDDVISLEPDRIAIYSYAHVTWVAKQQRGFEREDLPGSAARLDLFTLALRRLMSAGYLYVGLDHFARPSDALATAHRDGSMRRNFMGYTTQAGLNLLGFGPSAISEFDHAYSQNARDIAGWTDAIESGEFATIRGHRLSREDEERRFVISQLLCQGEVTEADYVNRFEKSFFSQYGDELRRLEPLLSDHLVEPITKAGLRLTKDGRILARNVASVFDAYLSSPIDNDGSKPRFSQSL